MFRKIMPILIGFVLGMFFGDTVKEKLSDFLPGKANDPQ